MITASGSSLRLQMQLDGDEAIDVSLSRFGDAVSDFSPFWTDVLAPNFFADVQRNFDLQGKLAGGWSDLSPRYRAWKRIHYPGRLILERTLALRNSLAWNGRALGPGGIFTVSPTAVTLGTAIPYAQFHQHGTGRMPARKVLFLRAATTYGRWLHTWVVGVIKAAGLPASGLATTAGDLDVAS